MQMQELLKKILVGIEKKLVNLLFKWNKSIVPMRQARLNVNDLLVLS